MKVEFSKKNENPYYGMSNTLSIYQDATKGKNVYQSVLDGAWGEANTDEKKAVLFTVLFHVGDITNRNHNLFKGKVQNGGNAQRVVFRDNLIIIDFDLA